MTEPVFSPALASVAHVTGINPIPWIKPIHFDDGKVSDSDPQNEHDNKPAWLRHLDESIREISEVPTCKDIFDILTMIKNLLVPGDDTAVDNTPVGIAKRIDAYFGAQYEPNAHLYLERSRSKRSKEWAAYIKTFYDQLYDIASEIPHTETGLLIRIVDMIIALKKLPARPARLWIEWQFEYVDCMIWESEPFFESFLSQLGHIPDIADEFKQNEQNEDTARGIREGFEMYLAYCTFHAHCIARGLDSGYRRKTYKWQAARRFGAVRNALEAGLETAQCQDGKMQTTGLTWPEVEQFQCRVIGAAFFILIAGDVLSREAVMKDKQGWSREDWKRWADEFGALAEEEPMGSDLTLTDGGADKMREMAAQARGKMVELHPELFNGIAGDTKEPDEHEEGEEGMIPERKNG